MDLPFNSKKEEVAAFSHPEIHKKLHQDPQFLQRLDKHGILSEPPTREFRESLNNQIEG
jgi:hypothetical protein